MIETHLSGMKARNGTLIFVCSSCKTPPNFTFGARDKGELALLMLCPKCGIVLANEIRWKLETVNSATSQKHCAPTHHFNPSSLVTLRRTLIAVKRTFHCPNSAVISMGRRNTKLEPAWH
jgi:hypothetical protein